MTRNGVKLMEKRKKENATFKLRSENTKDGSLELRYNT